MNDNIGTDAETDVLYFGAPDDNEDLYKESVSSLLSGRKQAYADGGFNREASLMPNSVESDRLKGRVFSFKQLYDFNNLFLNKSYLKKRTKVNENHIDTL